MTVRLSRSAVIEAPAGEVWHVLRDFNAHEAWHPAVAVSRIEAAEPADRVGAVRAFRLEDGSFLREQLIALSDREMRLVYCLLEAPVRLDGYVATLQLRPVTEGDATFVSWSCRFDPPAADAAALAKLVSESIYEAGLEALKRRFATALPRLRSRQAPALATAPVEARAATADAVPGAPVFGQAIVISSYGGPEVMEERRVEVPAPGPDEVRLRHRAIGVNLIDVHCRTGAIALVGLPGILGLEGAGTVTEVGPGVQQVAPGERVVYAGLPPGAYAEMRVVPVAIAVRLPAGVDDETAAAVFLKGLMAGILLDDVEEVAPGKTVLVRAAAGGVGLILCAVASHRGARVIGAVSSRAKAEAALGSGCATVVVAPEQDLLATIRDETDGRGVDAVFDPIGGDSFDGSLEALSVRGHFVSYGQASGPIGARDIDRLSQKSIRLSRPNFAHFTADRSEFEARAARLFALVREGIVRPTIAGRLPLAQAREAHRRLEARDNIGAYLLVP